MTNITAGTARKVHFRFNKARHNAALAGAENDHLFVNTLRNTMLVLAAGASLSAIAPTTGYAFSEDAQTQCTGDAFRLCSSEIPNIPKITACMVKKRTNLSVGCRAVMDREASMQKSKVAAQ